MARARWPPSRWRRRRRARSWSCYPHRWAVPRDTWGLLFDSAEQEIGILVYSGMFLADDPGLLALFRAKAEQGVRIRILLGDPDSPEVAHAASTRASTTRSPPRSAT